MGSHAGAIVMALAQFGHFILRISCRKKVAVSLFLKMAVGFPSVQFHSFSLKVSS
jgi:hypothetical protein